MTRAVSSLDNPVPGAEGQDAERGSLKGALAAAFGVAALLVVAGCAETSDDRRSGAPSGGTGTTQGAGVASGAAGGAAGGTIGGTGGGTGTPAGAATRPGTTGGGDIGTPVTPDTTSKGPPTTR